MPRDGSGVYTAPPGTTATPNSTIESSKYNALVDDLVADANAARPLTAGGTGATSAATARTALGLGSLALQEADNVAVTGGSITGITDLAIADGGTGASTATAARGNLGFAIVTTDNAVARFDGTTGQTQDSALTVTDAGSSAMLSWSDDGAAGPAIISRHVTASAALSDEGGAFNSNVNSITEATFYGEAVTLPSFGGQEGRAVISVATPAISNQTVEVLFIDKDGIQFQNGAGQIAFPATQNASSDANTLDDYEEGTFTPTIVSTGGGSGTYSSQIGTYTKIGNRVSITGSVVWTNHSGSGTMSIGGIPFSCATAAAVALGWSNLTYTSTPFGLISGTAIVIRTAATGAAEANLALDTSGTLYFSVTYNV
jgi:hypothetical protein